MIQKKIPMRQCTGCREMKPKKDLIRVVRSPEGVVSLDTRGKSSGRGAYLCPDAECFRKAQKSRALERSLETPMPPELWDELLSRLESEAKTDG